MHNLTTIEKSQKASRFPVTVTALPCERKPSMFPLGLPALVGRKNGKPVPVGILSIELKSGPVIFVDGNKVEMPNGVRKRITVRALKKLGKAYLGSVLMVQRGNSWVRLRDHEAIEVPKSGEDVKMKSLPSFRTE